MSDPFRFCQYQPHTLEIIDTTLRDGQQTSLLHDHHKYFFTRAVVRGSVGNLWLWNSIHGITRIDTNDLQAFVKIRGGSIEKRDARN